MMLGIIGGTGLGEALFGQAFVREHDVATPFGSPSSRVRIVSWEGTEVAVLARHGDGHLVAPSQVPYRANIFALKKLGVTRLLVTGAVGSLREEVKPRDLVIVDQLIDRTYRRVPTFFDEGIAVHAEFADPYCGLLRKSLLAAAREVSTSFHERGTYVCIEGPEFSTVAEAHMHRTLGATVVGMTALPEARLAREAEMCCALVAFATDYDCWRPHPEHVTRQALLTEIIGHVRAATENAVTLLRHTIADLAAQSGGGCACQSALELGIWSNRDRIAKATIDHYGPLVSKYLGPT